jgi:ABC-type cobalamin/Fe3+-siderophores transport system ATPase subunit
MRISSFAIQNQRSIGNARCENAPRLMVIAGPNGTGKSTLLNALRTAPGAGPILYVGPHRVARRQQVQMRHLLGSLISFEELLARSDTPGYDGIALLGGTRDPWSIDDTANYLKHGLCQIESERQEAVSRRYDAEGEIVKGSLPDPWSPLRELTSSLLPHLAFETIDTSNRSVVKCLWRVHGQNILVDLDDLSSGEKAVVQIFYPLLEQRIRAILSEIRHAQVPAPHPEICVLIDEPDLHLHPSLQLKVFDYLRLLSSDANTQFIIATHSPTIVEYATFDELYLLRPVELVQPGENQLVQVATDEERLALLRDVFGTTSNLTAMQPLVVVEGPEAPTTGKSVPDRKLYRALHPGFDRAVLISGGGKAECIKLVQSLNNLVREFSPRVRAVALLDQDIPQHDPPPNVKYLPVSMIENLLLDPDAIWEAIQSIVERTGLSSIDDVEAALDAVLEAYEEREVTRRALRGLGADFFRAEPPPEGIQQQLESHIASLREKYEVANIRARIETAAAQVQEIHDGQRRRELFDGKAVLEDFYKLHLSKAGMSRGIFAYEAARYARRRKSVTAFFDQFHRELAEIEIRAA